MSKPTAGEYDFIIIGGGIAGASIAFELSLFKNILLIEREDAFAYHTTGRSAATYIELLHNQTIVALSRASKGFLSSPPSGFTDIPLLKRCGCIITANITEQQSLESAFEQAIGYGTEAEMISAQEISKRIPFIRTEPQVIFAGIYEPQAQHIDVDGLFQGYIKGIRVRGSHTHTRTSILEIKRSDGYWHVQTSQHSLRSPVIINAAGAWADSVAEAAGVTPIGYEPKKRTMISFDAPANVDISTWPMMGNISGSFYFIPEAGQLLGSPADETPSPPCDAQPDELGVATAVYNIEQHTHLQISKINSKWAGLRTFAPDRLPVVGFDAGTEGFFWFAGQGGFGIQTAPALAKLGAALALKREETEVAKAVGIDLPIVLPDRFR